MHFFSYDYKRKMRYLPLRTKLVWIVAIMAIIRIITCIPLPFINRAYLETLKGSIFSSGVFGAMTGASFEKMGLFALSISPYITASIVVQLMTIVIPKLEELAKDGESGREKYRKITVLTGVGLAFVQALMTAIGFGRQGLIQPYNVLTAIAACVLWTAGAAILILIGEWIENFGLGSGISLLLLCNILSSIPGDFKSFTEMYVIGKKPAFAVLAIALFIAVFAAIVVACVFLTSTVKNIHVTYSGKVKGSGYAAKQTIPIPLVTCSVMPIIFSSSLCSLPAIIMSLTGSTNTVLRHIANALSSSYWFNRTTPWYTLGAVLYVALTYLFTLFYLQISFNAKEISENLRRSGGTIPGIRPGKPTEEILSKTIRKTALWGNTLLTGMVLIMFAVTGLAGLGSLAMSGTSSIIAVSVIGEILEKIKAERVVGSYKSVIPAGAREQKRPGLSIPAPKTLL